MKLSVLLQAIERTWKEQDAQITRVTDDSRLCEPNSVFVCHDAAEEYAAEALRRGAVLVIAPRPMLSQPCITVENTRRAYSALCRAFFGTPDRRLTLAAVTGTSGKTTVASMLAYLLEMNGRRCGLLSTVTNAAEDSTMTTPDPFALYAAMRAMVDAGKEFCVLEASSQGLAEERLHGLTFSLGIFTNLGHDHLDVHGTFERYRDAKLRLFAQSEAAVVNLDDPNAAAVIAACPGRSQTFSLRCDAADFTAKELRRAEGGQSFVLVGARLIHRFSLRLPGDFNVEHAMAAVVAAMHLGLSVDDCADALRTFSGVRGRMELLETPLPFHVMIDFAHTPESLRRALLSLRRLCRRRLIVVFGCGGDRDKTKRAQMGSVALGCSDLAVITSDNPRTEDPAAIIDDILSGTEKSKTPVFIREDRRSAIEFALSKAKPGDLVLLAGKGHETYQLVGTEKRPFDERAIVADWIRKENEKTASRRA